MTQNITNENCRKMEEYMSWRNWKNGEVGICCRTYTMSIHITLTRCCNLVRYWSWGMIARQHQRWLVRQIVPCAA